MSESRHAAPKPHPDPCPPPPICELDCLVRPEFHCGQELTDEHLNGLVRWTDRRLARVRFRDGWGIVCGLHVCIDASCPTRVEITPGYAVDCCGNDLVLCEPACIDLREHCPEHCDPEIDKDEAETTDANAHLPADTRRVVGYDPDVCKRLLRHGLVPVDICLQRAETAVEQIPAPGRCGCGPDAGCGCGGEGWSDPGGGKDPCLTTRHLESARPVSAVADCAEDPWPEASEWERRWRDTADFVAELVRRLRAVGYDEQADLDEIRRWLLTLPICTLGYLRSRFEPEQLPAEHLRTTHILELAFWLIVDRRLGLVHCDCHTCSDDDRVCIARVWLIAKTEDTGRQICRIAWIDHGPSVRRLFAPVWPPRLPGHVNIAAWAFGRHGDDAALRLARVAIHPAGTSDFALPSRVGELQAFAQQPPYVPWNVEPTLEALSTPFGRWVVAWDGVPPQPTKPGDVYEDSESAAVLSGSASAAQTAPATSDLHDDLHRITGVGSARARILERHGMHSFAGFAQADSGQLVDWLNEAGGKRVDIDGVQSMQDEARRLARGG